ncbi:DUF1674 domain-containing protein [uncultured Jannaschia sp.]|uniref:DUF1674 domain-containing protein n=1 Tax=uncultured Jannaschia sp. TaxID=293347 RepID=UPI0026303348|nr:DUF1674 domain-containing protein [uncultured Jannaschia sp.]
MAQRMNVDPTDLPEAPADAPACPTGNRDRGAEFMALTPAEEAARRAALPDVARRALEEAEARRRDTGARPVELGGRDGPEPVRYGDWERKGIAIDF